jgi:acyl-CoA synthetase (AMP-forming)/AMP-acid ligase II
MSIDELDAAVRERLSAFKVPAIWVTAAQADAVPMSATAKVDKAALQELLRREGRQPGASRSAGTQRDKQAQQGTKEAPGG